MDSRPPHAIVDDLALVPKAERKHYVPLSKELAKKLIAMNPIERGQWLREHPGDIDLVRRIQKEAKRTKKRAESKKREVEEREARRIARGMRDGTL